MPESPALSLRPLVWFPPGSPKVAFGTQTGQGRARQHLLAFLGKAGEATAPFASETPSPPLSAARRPPLQRLSGPPLQRLSRPPMQRLSWPPLDPPEALGHTLLTPSPCCLTSDLQALWPLLGHLPCFPRTVRTQPRLPGPCGSPLSQGSPARAPGHSKGSLTTVQ